jgi:hypothetical protein
MVPRHVKVAFVVATSLAALVGACKPKVGATCTAGQAACGEPKTGLFCGEDGTFHTMTCSGPAGCEQSGAVVNCDNGIAAVGDGCNTPDDAACSPDSKNALLCKHNVFTVAETCKGPGGCKVSGDTITCDNDVSDPGDPCRAAGDYACTSNRGMVLRCDANKMTALNTCRGPKACAIVPHPAENKVEFVCDDSLAMPGDACDTNGEEACSMDKKSILVCAANKFGSPKPCGGPAGCTYDDALDRYGCDQGALGDAGASDATAPDAGKAAPAGSPGGPRRR